MLSKVTYDLDQKIKNVREITADISFLIADLKYKDGLVKICEFGEGTLSRFKGHDKMYGEGTMWSMLWDHMKQFERPLFFVGSAILDQDVKREIAYHDFTKIGGYCFQNIAALEASQSFFQATKHLFFKGAGLKDHKGVLMFKHINASDKSFQDLRRRHPGFLVLNSAVAPFVNDKYFTNILFQHDEVLEKYKPKFILCDGKYTKDLAGRIQETLPGNKFVIKPLDDFKGRGVMIIEQNQLDQTLNIILNKNRDYKSEDRYLKDLYKYWHAREIKHFLVEEYCSSKEVEFEGKLYDPTMRLVFALSYDQGKIRVTYFDAFWKFPTKSLADQASLTEKHKSLGTIPLPISKQDEEAVRREFDKFLPRLYMKMIGIINHSTIN